MKTTEEYIKEVYDFACPAVDSIFVEKEQIGAKLYRFTVHADPDGQRLLVGKGGGTSKAVKVLASIQIKGVYSGGIISTVHINKGDDDPVGKEFAQYPTLTTEELRSHVDKVIKPLVSNKTDLNATAVADLAIIEVYLDSGDKDIFSIIKPYLNSIIRIAGVARGQEINLNVSG